MDSEMEGEKSNIHDNHMDPQLCATIACDIYKHLQASEVCHLLVFKLTREKMLASVRFLLMFLVSSHIFIFIAQMKKRPSTDFMERIQKDISLSMRAILIDWLVEGTLVSVFLANMAIKHLGAQGKYHITGSSLSSISGGWRIQAHTWYLVPDSQLRRLISLGKRNEQATSAVALESHPWWLPRMNSSTCTMVSVPLAIDQSSLLHNLKKI